MKSTEAYGHDPHDTSNQNPFVAQKINHKQNYPADLCFSLCDAQSNQQPYCKIQHRQILQR